MNDPNNLESELARMQPRKLSRALHDAIESHLDSAAAHSWSDRFLLCAIALGSTAACVIAFLLVLDSVSPAIPSNFAVPSAETIHSQSQTLAQADQAWIDDTK